MHGSHALIQTRCLWPISTYVHIPIYKKYFKRRPDRHAPAPLYMHMVLYNWAIISHFITLINHAVLILAENN